MTASKLEESIEKLAKSFLYPKNVTVNDLSGILRAFAEAVRAIPVDNTPQVKDWFCTVCGNKPACGCQKPPEPQTAIEANESLMGKGREPKECECICHKGFVAKRCQYCAANHNSPAALPDEVKEKMNLFIRRNWDKHYPLPMDFSAGLQELLRLCLSLRKP